MSASTWQRQLFLQVHAEATLRAASAEHDLLLRLAAPDVREALLQCCPNVAELSPFELLKAIRDEFAVSEIVSGFSAFIPGAHGGPRFWFGPTVKESRNETHLENLWEVWLKENWDYSKLQAYIYGMDDLEVHGYGFKPFAQRARPASAEETRERSVYCAVNTLRFGAGSPLYGEVSVVLSPAAAARTTLLAPFDTGSWIFMCNATSGTPPWFHYPHDCSAYNGRRGLGTMAAFEHLWLQNEAWWLRNSSTLPRSLARLLSPFDAPSALMGIDFVRYFEAMPAATLSFETDIKLVIADFSALWGEAVGQLLRAWCSTQRWPLAWALGLNRGRSHGVAFWDAGGFKGTFGTDPFPRFLDPELAVTAGINITVSQFDLSAFDASWESAAASRIVALQQNKSFDPKEWSRRWSQLRPNTSESLWLGLLRPRACADTERCLGVTRKRNCACVVPSLRKTPDGLHDTPDGLHSIPHGGHGATDGRETTSSTSAVEQVAQERYPA
uniref:Uncharacterized protein n=1 Tax=Chrysotila carterae TaxID=13221 RepID=A0A7S4BK56_CHRCT